VAFEHIVTGGQKLNYVRISSWSSEMDWRGAMAVNKSWIDSSASQQTSDNVSVASMDGGVQRCPAQVTTRLAHIDTVA
jgi:hypothetical protein